MSMYRLLPKIIATFAAVGLFGLMGAAQAQDPTVDVKFPRGASGTTIEGSITGYDGVKYRVGVSAGQKMSVQLDTDNPSSYFNITAPGASEALFNGSIDGNSTTFEIPSSGNYVINVYLMRNAARRNETANYSLTIYVENAATSSVAPTEPDFADGLAGGPDFWQVHGLKAGDTLNVRASASSSARVLGKLAEGDVLRNRGCRMTDGTRWCQVEGERGLKGWVAGRYLHESFADAPSSATRAPQPKVVVPSKPAMVLVVDMLPRFCAGEASARFGVRPQDLTTNLPIRIKQLYLVQGYFDQADGGTKFFNCYFQADGSFISVS